MIPQLVTVRYRGHPEGRGLRLYVPVVPVLLLLSPLLVLAVLGAVVACVVFRFSPVDALRGTWRLFWALPGARIELDDGQTALLISVR
jgi:hypothetical protein